MDFLVNYTVEHFGYEEKLMTDSRRSMLTSSSRAIKN
jgi:hemerythrin